MSNNTKIHIQKFDFPLEKRVESGVVKFNNERKGLFLSGDDCMALKIELNKLLENAKTGSSWFENPEVAFVLESIEDVLSSEKS